MPPSGVRPRFGQYPGDHVTDLEAKRMLVRLAMVCLRAEDELSYRVLVRVSTDARYGGTSIAVPPGRTRKQLALVETSPLDMISLQVS
jgi:hypothetical protein